MRHCPICQASYEDDARFCPDDGSQLRDSPDPYIGKVFLGQFEIREICGRGSMGTVYRAWQNNMDREVAVKVLRRDLLRDPRIVKRFRREAKASARLSHPSIITVYVVGDTADGVPFMAMEFVKGRSLDEVLAETARLPPLRCIHIVRQICSALAEAHAQNIVHRDLKPENIFLCPTSHTPDFVKILDFGIAKILYANEESLHTQTGAIFGTPYFLSPEQASGGDIDHRCDLYALGVILFRMLTGRLPFDKESGVAVLIQHLREAPPRPRDLVPSLPAPLEHVVMKALEKAPANRWQSANEMGSALEAIQSFLMPGGRPTGPRPALVDGQALHSTVPDDSTASLAAPAAVLPATLAQAPLVGPLSSAPRGPVAVRAAAAPAARAVREAATHEASARPSAGPDSTMDEALRVTSRRRMLLHVLAGLGSMAGGSAIGALLYWRRARAARRDEQLPPAEANEGAPTPDAIPGTRAPDARATAQSTIAPDVARTSPPVKADHAPHTPHRHKVAASQPTSQPATPSSAPASQPVPRRRSRHGLKRKRPAGPAPVGPDSVGDHGGAERGDEPLPEKKKDEPYDLID